MSGSRPLGVCCGRIIGLLAATAALVLLQACSAVKLAYNNASELAYWWIDSYADLNEQQSQQLRAELAQLQQWHRSAEMPRVAELLKKTRLLASADTSPEQVCSLVAEARSRLDTLIARAEPAATALAMGMAGAQIAHLETKLEKTTAEWRAEWTKPSPQEIRAKRLKTAVDRAEQFYGSLEERQVALLRNAIAEQGFDPARSLSERARRNQDLLQTLRLLSSTNPRPGASQSAAALHAYIERLSHSPNPVYHAHFEQLIQDSCKTTALLHNSATAEQRARAVRKLAAYESDARTLAATR